MTNRRLAVASGYAVAPGAHLKDAEVAHEQQENDSFQVHRVTPFKPKDIVLVAANDLARMNRVIS
jgi:hypothetical protein